MSCVRQCPNGGWLTESGISRTIRSPFSGALERRHRGESFRWYRHEVLICEGDLIGKTHDRLRTLHFQRGSVAEYRESTLFPPLAILPVIETRIRSASLVTAPSRLIRPRDRFPCAITGNVDIGAVLLAHSAHDVESA